MDAVHRLRAIQLHLARPAAKAASDETIAPAPGHELFSDDTVYTPWAPGGSVGGKVAAGWEPVKAAFAENFAKGLEKGAQLVIRIAGETVVDLHGASPSNQSLNGQPFGPDTMTNIYSSGKQIETVVMAILVDRGLVSYDDKVAQHWPAFAQGDKGNITIADVMRHEGGCPYFLAPSVTSGTAGSLCVSSRVALGSCIGFATFSVGFCDGVALISHWSGVVGSHCVSSHVGVGSSSRHGAARLEVFRHRCRRRRACHWSRP